MFSLYCCFVDGRSRSSKCEGAREQIVHKYLGTSRCKQRCPEKPACAWLCGPHLVTAIILPTLHLDDVFFDIAVKITFIMAWSSLMITKVNNQPGLLLLWAGLRVGEKQRCDEARAIPKAVKSVLG